MRTGPSRPLTAIFAFALATMPATAITIQFDYSRDLTGFFTDPARKALLDQAASSFTGFTDTLLAITPTATNHWTASFVEPSTGLATGTAVDLVIPADTVKIFVGASDLPGTTLGFGGPGGYSYTGVTQSFANAVNNRGETGDTGNIATATDFGRWGGAISFDSVANWHFDSTTSGLAVPENDFLSVAIHEIAHVLGIGTADSFKHWVSGTSFTGPTAKSVNGGANVPLNPQASHWAEGTASKLPGTSTSQEAAMDPNVTQGTRKLFTVLDYAGLKDIGWEVPANLLQSISTVPGDADADGDVDLDDQGIWAANFTGSLSPGAGSSTFSQGDFDGDEDVDLDDQGIWASNFTGSLAPAGLIAAPEPTALLAPGLAIILAARRRRA